MSRARTLAGAIGSDGVLNVSDVAGLAAVASSGSASDLSTGTLPLGRYSPANGPINVVYGDSGATTKWMYMGQWDTAQMGRRIHFKFFGNAGFNADINQNSLVDAYFKTSNNSSSQTGSSGNFYGDGFMVAYMAGSAGNTPSIIRVVQVSSTSYKFYAYIGTYSGTGAMFQVDMSDGTWTSSGTYSDPSGNYVDLPQRNMLATTTTGSVTNQSNSFTVPINPNYSQSVVYLRGRHDTNLGTAYMGTQIDGSQVSMEANTYTFYRGSTAWVDTGTTTWTKLAPNLIIDANLDWGGVFTVRQRHGARPSVMIDFQYVYTAVGGARTIGSAQYTGSGGSITGLIFDWDISSGTQNMWAEWQVVGIK